MADVVTSPPKSITSTSVALSRRGTKPGRRRRGTIHTLARMSCAACTTPIPPHRAAAIPMARATALPFSEVMFEPSWSPMMGNCTSAESSRLSCSSRRPSST